MTNNSEHQTPRLRIYTMGMSLGILLAVSFGLCVAFGLLFPGATMYQAWVPLLPGFKWISLPGFFWVWLRALPMGGILPWYLCPFSTSSQARI